jgi:hypothetical protein
MKRTPSPFRWNAAGWAAASSAALACSTSAQQRPAADQHVAAAAEATKDGSRTHVAAYWGGTAFNWIRGPGPYITPERPPEFWFDSYARSAQRFRDLAARAGADVILSNHGKYDDTPNKIELIDRRGAGAPHPYVVGSESVGRFFTVAEQCALAGAG